MYIDPNTGGMLFQVLAVLFGIFSAAILFFSGRIRLMIAKLRRQVRERKGSEPLQSAPDEKSQPPAA